MQTHAAKILVQIIQQMEIDCEVIENVTPHRIDIQVRPAKRSDYLCLLGRSGKTFHEIREIVTVIAHIKDQRALTWHGIGEPRTEENERREKLSWDGESVDRFAVLLAWMLFGVDEAIEYKEYRSDLVGIVMDYPPSLLDTVIASEGKLGLQTAVSGLFSMIGLIHGRKVSTTLIPAAPEPERKQPGSAAGRFVKEIGR